MSTVSADFYKSRVVLALDTSEARTLAQVFERAATGPDGKIRDAGWHDTSEGLKEAAEAVGKSDKTLSDDEMEIRTSGNGVRMAFDPGIAPEVCSEIESGMAFGLLDASWTAIADAINANAADLTRD